MTPTVGLGTSAQGEDLQAARSFFWNALHRLPLAGTSYTGARLDSKCSMGAKPMKDGATQTPKWNIQNYGGQSLDLP